MQSRTEKTLRKRDVLLSLVSLFFIGLFLASSVSPMVAQKIITTPLTTNSRYGITFPALDYIEDLETESVVAIGSSIIRSAVNGACISEQVGKEGLGVFNLGISGGNPYTEMVQTPALIRASPDLVLIDFGPNGLWDFYKSDVLDEYIQFRFTINSINMRTDDLGDWLEHIREVDEQWVAQTDLERIDLTSSYSQLAAEELLKEYISSYSGLIEYEERAPLPGDSDWHQYLMKPYYREPFFELKSTSEIEDFISEKMPVKADQGVYNPKSSGTLNHAAYDYIINTLRESGIPVLLVATPHHPLVHNYLSPNQLDGFNESFEYFTNLSGVHGANMYWETWHNSMFRDRNHLGVNGREYFCERISPLIEELLETDQLEEELMLNEKINLSNYLETSCNGTNRRAEILNEIEFIQVEAFSDCAKGEGIGSQDRWEFRTGTDHRGSGYLHALPEDHSFYGEKLAGSRLDYNLTFQSGGEYFVWVKMRGEGYSNDSIQLSWKSLLTGYGSIVSYKSYGWSSKGQWEWEPEFNRNPLSINVSKNDKVTLSLWMQEDGVMIDEIMITSIKTLNPKSTDVYSIAPRPVTCLGSESIFEVEHGQEAFIEVEDFSMCTFGQEDSLLHGWETFSDDNSSSEIFLKALPEKGVHMRDGPYGPGLIYDLDIKTPGTYYVWLSMRGNSYNNDSIGVSWIEESNSTSLIYASYGWDSSGQWEWEPRVTRAPLQFTVSESGFSSIMLTMREDGVEVDRILITSNIDFDPIIELI